MMMTKMSSFNFNKWFEQDITAWNEGEDTRLDGGISQRDKSTEKTLRVFIINEGSMFFFDENGRFESDGMIFQVSKYELENNSFTITTGKTHIEFKNNVYRVVNKYDYSDYIFTSLIECKCVKIIDVE